VRQAESDSRQVPWKFPAVLTTAMALSMLPLYLLGALGPYLVSEFRITKPLLGLLVTVGFGVAALLSLLVGPLVTALGPRRCLIALFGGCVVVLTLFAASPVYGVLVAAVAASGVPQALANPVTNQLIAATVPAQRRGGITGVKQSGVQLGAFLAGLPLAGIAAVVSWRAAVGLAAATALAAALASLTMPADPTPAKRPQWTTLTWPRGNTAWLCGFSVLLGSGIAAVNTYVALYAVQQLRMSPEVAAALVAALGVAGIVGRIGWSRVAARGRSPGVALPPLAIGAVLAAIALIAATRFGTGWAWLGVVGVGSCAVSANAVSMVIVIASARPSQVARDSAVVSAGFFAGFALGPPGFGLLVEATGGHYETGWALVAVEFLAAGIVAWTSVATRVKAPSEPARPDFPGTRRRVASLAVVVGGLLLGSLIVIDRSYLAIDHPHGQPNNLAAPPQPSPPFAAPTPPIPPDMANIPFALPAPAIPTPAAPENTSAPLRLVAPTPHQADGPQQPGEPTAVPTRSPDNPTPARSTTPEQHGPPQQRHRVGQTSPRDNTGTGPLEKSRRQPTVHMRR
jgi:predicted MFS family arabinose efflux permease